jgi:hypothetical protein
MKNPVNDRQPRPAPKNIFKRKRKIRKHVRGGAFYVDAGEIYDDDMGVSLSLFAYTADESTTTGFRVTRTKKNQ